MAEENPSAPKETVARPSTLKLKPIIRPTAVGKKALAPAKPGATAVKLPAKPAAPAPAAAPAVAAADAKSSTSSLEALKNVTQNLKSITAPIPQQAILHKTGIIADPSLTEAQMAAAKARTSRISLSDAMGVAPVKAEPTPMKTIRIKRPVDIPGATESMKATAPAPAPAPVAEEAPAAAPAAQSATVTQRKTLKISRPGSAVRPAGKFGLKKPGEQGADKPANAAPAGDEVADIPEMPADSAFVPANGRLAEAAGVAPAPQGGKGWTIAAILFQIAACGVMGLLAYLLYVDFEAKWY